MPLSGECVKEFKTLPPLLHTHTHTHIPPRFSGDTDASLSHVVTGLNNVMLPPSGDDFQIQGSM